MEGIIVNVGDGVGGNVSIDGAWVGEALTDGADDGTADGTPDGESLGGADKCSPPPPQAQQANTAVFPS